MMKRAIAMTLAVSFAVSSTFAGVKNVIVLIPDGCDATVQTVSRWYKGEDLAVDKMKRASQKIYMANSVITGSAAAATAFAAGHKTTARFLGIGPRTEDMLEGFESDVEPYAPIATVLEAAKVKGKSVGLVSTSRITHATPAGYAVHIHDRGLKNDKMEHLVYNNLDVAFGGGFRHLIPQGESYVTTFGATWNGKRTDGENLYKQLRDRGYQIVDNRDDMMSLSSAKVWGLFDDSHLDADMDREEFHPTQPSIAEMTGKAIELLSKNPRGFFLMVEGSQVDWAGHNNDPAYMVRDFLAWDDAVEIAQDFADENPHTLVLAFPDHNTGGMKVGSYNSYGMLTPNSYTEMPIDALVEPLKKMQLTANGVLAKMSEDGLTLEEAVSTYWGIDLTEEDLADYDSLRAQGVSSSYSLARMVSFNHTPITWSSHGHNAEDVQVWSYGWGEIEGTIDNTEIATCIADQMNVDLDRMTEDLYVDLGTVFDEDQWSLSSTDRDDNPVVTFKDLPVEIPVDKDMVSYKGKTYKIGSLVVYAPVTGKVFVPKSVIYFLKYHFYAQQIGWLTQYEGTHGHTSKYQKMFADWSEKLQKYEDLNTIY